MLAVSESSSIQGGMDATGSVGAQAVSMQSEIADPYAVLGISRMAGAEELKRAYRKLSMACHPDRHVGKPDAQRLEAERRFKLINAAYLAIGETLRAREAGQAPVGPATAGQDARLEAIRSVVASAALRLVPNLPRHIYRRVVSMVESLLIDTVALGDKAFSAGFDAAVRDALAMTGLGMDSKVDALNVLDAAVDDLQWRGKGADPETWQTLLRPLEAARESKPPLRNAPTPQVTPPSFTLNDLLRPEPVLVAAQGGMAMLVLLL